VEEAKKKAKEQGIENWKRLVKTAPTKLDAKLKMLISQMYMAVANETTGKTLFDSPKLAEVMRNFQSIKL
jgi:hypothetical protein